MEFCRCDESACEAGFWCNRGTCLPELAPESVLVRIENPGPAATLAHVPLDLDPDVFDYDLASPTGDDLRFSSDGVIADIPYFIEHWDPAGGSRVWMRVGDLEPGQTDVELRFGDATLLPASSGVDTFLFFDDFEGEALDPARWVVDGEFEELSVQDGTLVVDADSNDLESLDFVHSVVGFDSPIVVRTRYRCPSVLGCASAGFLFANVGGDRQVLFANPSNPATNLGAVRFTGSGTGAWVTTTYPDVTSPEQNFGEFEVRAHLDGVRLRPTSFCNLPLGECDGEYVPGIQLEPTGSGEALDEVSVGFGAWTQTDVVEVDDVFVAIDLEPAPFAYVVP